MLCDSEHYYTDAATNIGTFSTTTDLYSALDTFGASLNDKDTRDICFTCTASPFGHNDGSEISARFYKASSGRYFVECYNTLVSTVPPILLWRWAGGWVKSNTAIFSTATFAGTTESGSGNLLITTIDDILILAASITNAQYMAYPVVWGQNNGKYLHVVDNNGSNAGGVYVSGTYWYIRV